jgi:hypothetical protein
MAQSDSFEMETIREFLSNYCGEMGVSRLDNTSEKPNNSEYVQQLRDYHLKYGYTGFPVSGAP